MLFLGEESYTYIESKGKKVRHRNEIHTISFLLVRQEKTGFVELRNLSFKKKVERFKGTATNLCLTNDGNIVIITKHKSNLYVLNNAYDIERAVTISTYQFKPKHVCQASQNVFLVLFKQKEQCDSGSKSKIRKVSVKDGTCNRFIKSRNKCCGVAFFEQNVYMCLRYKINVYSATGVKQRNIFMPFMMGSCWLEGTLRGMTVTRNDGHLVLAVYPKFLITIDTRGTILKSFELTSYSKHPMSKNVCLKEDVNGQVYVFTHPKVSFTSEEGTVLSLVSKDKILLQNSR